MRKSLLTRERADLERFPAAGPSPLRPGLMVTATIRNDEHRTRSGPRISELPAVLWKRPWWAVEHPPGDD
jgi:hypothetical protein